MSTLTLGQLLKHAIDQRLLDVHTALIGRVEIYDRAKQQADIQPVLKRALKNIEGEITQEDLPLLIDVPVLFPRAGGFFLSLPIKKGDLVQLIFNEVSIDDWVTNTASSAVSDRRFSLQGAVAIPGVYSEAQALLGAHKDNLVLGKDEGVQVHIDEDKIRLGSVEAHEALAIASKVESELNRIINKFNSHVHTGGTSAISPTSIMPAISSVATQKVVAE